MPAVPDIFSALADFFLSFISYFLPIHLQLSAEQNIVVITGCDTGMGEAIALRLSKQGYLVVAACLTEAGVQRLQSEVSKAVRCDVTKANDVEQLVRSTEQLILSSDHQARVWAVINNAGIAPMGYIDWFSIESARRVMEVNYFGLISVTKAFLPLLKQTQRSRLINISSLAGVSATAAMGGYCASKHAVEGLSKALQQELSPWNIHVININPGFVRTPLIEASIAGAFAEFERAPKEITSQYTTQGLENLRDRVTAIAEDPELVVSAVLQNITLTYPSLFNPIGFQGLFVRYWVTLVPQSVILLFDKIFAILGKTGPRIEALETIQNQKPKNKTI